MENVFKDAYFGKAYKTRDGRKAIYRICCLNHHLFTETDIFQCNDEGYVTGTIIPVSNLDIISEWNTEKSKEELDRVATLSYRNTFIGEASDAEIYRIGYINGYRKAKEE